MPDNPHANDSAFDASAALPDTFISVADTEMIAANWERLKLENPERYAAMQTRDALARLYRLYVVEMHGLGTCDCDAHVPVCAPCLARDALGIALADEQRAARERAATLRQWAEADERAAVAACPVGPAHFGDVPQ